MAETRYIYEIQPSDGGKPERGDLTAKSEAEARRKLRGRHGFVRLPANTWIMTKAEADAQAAADKSAKLRHLLHGLSEHHEWLQGKGKGQRANFSRLNLAEVSLRQKNLSHADLAETDLSLADLQGANLSGTNFVRATLRGADLRNADLRKADLSECDLREADLTGARLDGADLWRANIKGCTIDPKTLHAAFECHYTKRR